MQTHSYRHPLTGRYFDLFHKCGISTAELCRASGNSAVTVQ